MNKSDDTENEFSFWIRLRRRVAKFFLSQGNCSGSCNDCATCPWVDKEKYSFEIKRKERVG